MTSGRFLACSVLFALAACAAPVSDDDGASDGVASAGDELRRAPVPTVRYEADLATAWTDLACARVLAGKLSPPVASRVYAYVGIALYESSVLGMPDHASLAQSVRALGRAPVPRREVDVPTVLAEATSRVLASVLGAPDDAAVSELRDAQLEARRGKVSRAVEARSRAAGEAIAVHVLGRAANDGFRERIHVRYVPSSAPGGWRPTLGGAPEPLEPGWGTLLPFALQAADECDPEDPVPFSTSESSAFHAEARAVLEAARRDGAREHAIAHFWADLPGDSATPAGHWLAIGGQLLRERRADLATAAETLAVTTLAMADAFIASWHTKYRTDLLRPETYIRDHLDPAFVPLLRTPSFPEYTSGHSVASAAAAAVLADRLGDRAFVDRTGPAPRSFASLRSAADEAAMSRLHGGIHYPMGIRAGLGQGACVGARALERLRTR